VSEIIDRFTHGFRTDNWDHEISRAIQKSIQHEVSTAFADYGALSEAMSAVLGWLEDRGVLISRDSRTNNRVLEIKEDGSRGLDETYPTLTQAISLALSFAEARIQHAARASGDAPARDTRDATRGAGEGE
jgi:hypothetical protein